MGFLSVAIFAVGVVFFMAGCSPTWQPAGLRCVGQDMVWGRVQSVMHPLSAYMVEVCDEVGCTTKSCVGFEAVCNTSIIHFAIKGKHGEASQQNCSVSALTTSEVRDHPPGSEHALLYTSDGTCALLGVEEILATVGIFSMLFGVGMHFFWCGNALEDLHLQLLETRGVSSGPSGATGPTGPTGPTARRSSAAVPV